MKPLYIPTAQQVFDKVVVHLRRQAKRAVFDGRCQYRTDDGLRCALGCFIKPEAYTIAFEGLAVEGLIKALVALNSNSRLAKVLNEHKELFRALQAVHDGAIENDFRQGLARAAHIFGLHYDMPKDGVA